MKKYLITLFSSLVVVTSIFAGQTGGPVDLVNALVGTLSTFELSTGNLYPAITMPWGMNAWTPQTGKNGDGWSYTYTIHKLEGIKQTHQPSPWINDYGCFSLMPTTGKPLMNEEKRASWFSHFGEEATPYSYKVYLADYNVTAEVAPTMRAAIFRLTYPKRQQAYLTVDAFDHGSAVTIIPSERRIVGYTTRNSGGVPANFKNYFVLQFDHDFTYRAVADGDSLNTEATHVSCEHAGGVVGFGSNGGAVMVRVASSFISLQQAELNLKRELGDRTFENVKTAGAAEWNKQLGRIEVDHKNLDHARTFYTCLYRALIFPRSFYEYDAQNNPVHYSPFKGTVEKGVMFTDFGVWDVFRALFPLINLVYPEINTHIQEGFVNMYQESNFLPEWVSPGHRGCMVGNNSASVVADAYLSGLRGYDAEMLWKAVVHGANAVHPQVSSTGRLGFELYNKLGYVPCDAGINESAARTLEYAYDDWCIYKFGKALGKSELELAPFRTHALNYRNLFDKETCLMRGRKQDGSFQTPYNPLKWGDVFTEGNGWHYSWSVFHNPKDLISLMGGKQHFNKMLDSIFVQAPDFDDSYYHGVIHEIREMQIMNFGQYAHGNQPAQHIIYLYDWAGQPYKTQYWTREVMDRLYRATPDGYCGDEDNGQTSAWYVFSAMGFYPVCPGSNQFALGAPYFDQIRLHMPAGKTVIMTATGQSSQNRYIKAMTLNGKPYTKNFLRREDLKNGANIVFQMSAQPNKYRGINESDFPYSFDNELETNH
ncbi:MAG: GH92 family glycosyl hydrolase [Bacteroidaceae bacterium]|nr:GH92 family glycosyl hydrolase [Bacteroidaceae bacterium]